MASKSSAGTRAGLCALAVVMVASMGMGVGALIAAPDTPEVLRSAEPITQVPVTEREFTDRRTVELGLTLGQDVGLTSPGAGRVTRWDCQAGGELVSGRASLALDGKPVVSLATTSPLWRDLAVGEAGPDVEALQAELARLGYQVPVDARVGRATLGAVADLFAKAGDGAFRADTVPMSRVLWLPAATVSIASCETGTGQFVAGGDLVAARVGGLAGAAIAHLPETATAGERVVLIDGQDVPVDGTGAVTSPQALAMIAASNSYLQAVRASATTMTVPYTLAQPIQVSVVPPAALYQVDGQLACVIGDGKSRAVRVVGSELGQSFITFDEPASVAEVKSPPGDAPACR